MNNHDFIIVVDSRERTPFYFGDWPTTPGTLTSGDYSIVGSVASW